MAHYQILEMREIQEVGETTRPAKRLEQVVLTTRALILMSHGYVMPVTATRLDLSNTDRSEVCHER